MNLLEGEAEQLQHLRHTMLQSPSASALWTSLSPEEQAEITLPSARFDAEGFLELVQARRDIIEEAAGGAKKAALLAGHQMTSSRSLDNLSQHGRRFSLLANKVATEKPAVSIQKSRDEAKRAGQTIHGDRVFSHLASTRSMSLLSNVST